MREEERRFLLWLFGELYNHFESDPKLEECLKELSHALILSNYGFIREVRNEVENLDSVFSEMKEFLLNELTIWEKGSLVKN